MTKRTSEWGSQADADRMCQRNGFGHPDDWMVQQQAVLSGKVQIRIYGGVCPPDKLDLLSFDTETGQVRGWQPGGMIIDLPPEWDDKGDDWQPTTVCDPGKPCEFNLLQLGRHLRELREIEAPVVKRPNLGGRPASWDWGRAIIALGAHMLENKAVNNSPASFAAFLRGWFAEQSAGEGPDDKLIRQWAKEAYAGWTART